MQAKVMRLGHIGLAVRDLDAAIRFYTEVVGLSLTERFDYPEDEVGHGRLVSAGAFVRCDSTHHCISIFALKAEVSTDQAAARYGLHHIAFEMNTPEDLLSKYRELRDKEVNIVSARRGGPGNQPRFYANDLDGNLLEFYWGIDEIGWQGTPRAYPEIEEITLDQFDFDEFVAERERAANGVV
jgi:catechol 2,3-dioxygenase